MQKIEIEYTLLLNSNFVYLFFLMLKLDTCLFEKQCKPPVEICVWILIFFLLTDKLLKKLKKKFLVE